MERASKGEAHVIRLDVPTVPPQYVDLVYGAVGKRKGNQGLTSSGERLHDDSILIKTDGLPTYHLANVVDDHYMEITHVIRASVSWIVFTMWSRLIPFILIGVDVVDPETSSHV